MKRLTSIAAAGVALVMAGAFGVASASAADVAVCHNGVERVAKGTASCSAEPRTTAIAVGDDAFAVAGNVEHNVAVAVGNARRADATADGDRITVIVTPGTR